MFTGNQQEQESLFDQTEVFQEQDQTAKDYHVCDGTDRFFDPEYDENTDRP